MGNIVTFSRTVREDYMGKTTRKKCALPKGQRQDFFIKGANTENATIRGTE
jgi:hypothetical protein